MKVYLFINYNETSRGGLLSEETINTQKLLNPDAYIENYIELFTISLLTDCGISYKAISSDIFLPSLGYSLTSEVLNTVPPIYYKKDLCKIIPNFKTKYGSNIWVPEFSYVEESIWKPKRKISKDLNEIFKKCRNKIEVITFNESVESHILKRLLVSGGDKDNINLKKLYFEACMNKENLFLDQFESSQQLQPINDYIENYLLNNRDFLFSRVGLLKDVYDSLTKYRRRYVN